MNAQGRMNKKAFFCAFNSLLHPVSVGAIFLLLVNDHFLRYAFPSWWTGKIGDAAWLIFAPFICAMVFALLIPSRLTRQTRLVGGVSFLLVGGWFALAKTVPVF